MIAAPAVVTRPGTDGKAAAERGFALFAYGFRPFFLLAGLWAPLGVALWVAALAGLPLPEGSALPDLLFYLCGVAIGGAGGTLYSASRTLMVRHADPARAGEAFGLFALSGRATAEMDLSDNEDGVGRDLFAVFRRNVGAATDGAAVVL